MYPSLYPSVNNGRFGPTAFGNGARLTRLTNGFSKKWGNLKATYVLHFAHYNFCQIHSSIKCTAAMEAKITERVWEFEGLANISNANTHAGNARSTVALVWIECDSLQQISH
jgi:hypothetical protein